ncbi:uncharacterized protein LOC134718270 [Mytilus trossulus]|uniref:uncharacterized protein LOC134718270 n=1 Tax=Mytilus trossulus TaxID=6551 RepID=UPI00300706FD
MPQYCCVPGCNNSEGGHRFPKDTEFNLKWRVAIKRLDPSNKKLWKPGKYDQVCHNHFTPGDYRTTGLGERSRLKAEAIPSIFNFGPSIKEESPRAKRFKQRSADEPILILNNFDYPYEAEVISSEPNSEKPIITVDDVSSRSKNQGIQCDIPSFGTFSIKSFKFNDKLINYYTGFDDYDHFMIFFHCLGQAAYELQYKCSLLHPTDQLFLTLIKLRQAKEDVELAMLFKISESTVSRVIMTWINFLYFQLKELDVWPSKEIIEETMPVDFKKKFPNTRVILDATEVPIEKPTNVSCQSTTWSNYKHRNTLKTMIGCSPRGAVTFVSDAFGGSASDRQIVEKSELLNPDIKMFNKGDSIMADRGIMVQDLFASQDVYVNTPTFLKGKSQLDPKEVVHDRRVASKRIHIERVIGLSKSYKILKHGIPRGKLQLGSRVCFVLSNFRKNSVHKNA